uniref:UBC core domain-containing protein n=1 Tax=Romanomermis culicivorax TaxID=13658 RepID=A0A915K5A0_ROMCU
MHYGQLIKESACEKLKLPENVDLPRFVAEKDFSDDHISLNKRNHFGIVRRANNNEKMVLADIYLFDIDSYRIGECDRPILISNNHPLSFYEISSYAEYNYFPGVLVCKTEICEKGNSKSDRKQLNVGWARRKEVDGSVTVIWAEECLGATDMQERENCSLHLTDFFGGTKILRYRQETLQPWQIMQIKVQTSPPPKNYTTVDKEILSNDVDAEEDSYGKDEYIDDMSEEYQPKGYYSPSEYDMEEFDTSSQDINLLSPSERKKCVVLVVAVLHHMIPRLLKLLTLIRQYSSDHSYRKQLCRFLINYQDILSCLSNVDLADEECNMQKCFKRVVYDEEKSVIDDYEAKLVDNPHYKNGFDIWKRCLRRDRLIFQISDRLYDFNGAVQMLESDMQALSNRNAAKSDNDTASDEYRSKRSFISENTSVVRKASERKISVVMNLDEEKAEEFCKTLQEMSEEAIDDKLQEFQRNDPKVIEEIENLLSTVKTGFSLLTALLTLATINEPATESVRDFLSSSDYGDKNADLCGWSTIDMNDLPNSATCQLFLLLILANDEKATNLPCFCLFHQKEEDLNRASDWWGRTENDANSSPKCLIDKTMQVLEIHFQTNDSLSLFNGNYDLLRFCNDVGDSICFSILSINCRLMIVLKAFFGEDLQDMFAKIPKRVVENLDLDGIKFRDTSPSRVEKILIDRQNFVEESSSSDTRNVERLEFLPQVPEVHRFSKKKLSDTNIPKSFVVAVNRDVRLLRNSLPEGIYVKAYYDRMDLFSCMIIGPLGTPYADCPFFFDVRLKDTYPNRPPHVFFKSMSASLNPNLYEDGMVCLSLLGTWEGNETELWTPSSTLLQVFISIQSLILVPEPYYNEPGFEKDKATKSGMSKSRDYNEMIILRSLESFRKVLQSPPDPFKVELANHIRKNIDRITKTLENYYRDSLSSIESDSSSLPFPLFPVTRGFVTFVQNLANALVSEMKNFLVANPV